MKTEQLTIAVALIKNSKNEILMARRHAPNTPQIHDIWEFIGGGIEFAEDPEIAVMREVKEESGLDVKVLSLLPKVFSEELKVEDKVHLHVLVLTYICEVVGGEMKIGVDAEEEIAELKYMSLSEVIKLRSFNNISKTVEWIEANNFLD